MDLLVLFQEYGLFIGLVIYVVYSSQKRELEMRARENEFIIESRNREKEYINREERYIEIIYGMEDKFTALNKDVREIKAILEKGG